jgi:hypothetical protein
MNACLLRAQIFTNFRCKHGTRKHIVKPKHRCMPST